MTMGLSDGFLRLLTRFRRGQTTADEKKVLDTWYEALDDPDTDVSRGAERKERVWEKIASRTYGGVPQEVGRRKSRYRYYTGAAVLLLALGGVVWKVGTDRPLTSGPAISTHANSGKVFENRTREVRTLRLPDGSRVTLEPGARLSHGPAFAEAERLVHLEGNAFFAVAKNKKLPFVVKTDQIETRVLGTEFTIRKNAASGETEVAVLKGRVEVRAVTPGESPVQGENTPRVLLTADLKAVYQPVRQAFVTEMASVSQKVLTRAPDKVLLVFQDVPLRQVLQKLEAVYDVPIRVTDRKVLDCPITADLTGEPLPVQLEMLVTALNATYRLDDAGVAIEGGGCAPSPGSVKPK